MNLFVGVVGVGGLVMMESRVEVRVGDGRASASVVVSASVGSVLPSSVASTVPGVVGPIELDELLRVTADEVGEVVEVVEVVVLLGLVELEEDSRGFASVVAAVELKDELVGRLTLVVVTLEIVVAMVEVVVLDEVVELVVSIGVAPFEDELVRGVCSVVPAPGRVVRARVVKVSAFGDELVRGVCSVVPAPGREVRARVVKVFAFGDELVRGVGSVTTTPDKVVGALRAVNAVRLKDKLMGGVTWTVATSAISSKVVEVVAAVVLLTESVDKSATEPTFEEVEVIEAVEVVNPVKSVELDDELERRGTSIFEWATSAPITFFAGVVGFRIVVASVTGDVTAVKSSTSSVVFTSGPSPMDSATDLSALAIVVDVVVVDVVVVTAAAADGSTSVESSRIAVPNLRSDSSLIGFSGRPLEVVAVAAPVVDDGVAGESSRIAASSALNLKSGAVVKVAALVGVLVRTNVGTRGLERTVEVRTPSEEATNGVGRNTKFDVVDVVNVDVVDVVVIMRVDGWMIGVQSLSVSASSWRPERISSVLVPSSASSGDGSVTPAWISCLSLATVTLQMHSKSNSGVVFIFTVN